MNEMIILKMPVQVCRGSAGGESCQQKGKKETWGQNKRAKAAKKLAALGPNKKRHGATKNINEKKHFTNNNDFGRLSRFPEHIFLLGSFSEN